MPQLPVLTAETTTTARDPVAQEAFGPSVAYSSLTTQQKSIVDREIGAAFYDVISRARWFAEINPSASDLPVEWNELLRQMAAARCKRVFRSVSDYALHWRMYVEPLQDRIADHYTASWMSSGTLASDIQTAASMRSHVISIIIRQRHPVFLPVNEIDRQVREEFVRLWNCKWWRFRRRMMKLTLTTSGSVVSAEGYQISAFASREIVVQGTVSEARSRITWLDSTRAAEAASRFDGETGKPRYFYSTMSDGRMSIALLPIPDEDYTAFAMVYIGAPTFTLGGSGGEIDGMRMLPVKLRGHLRDRIVANIVSSAGREDNDAARLIRKAANDFELLAGQFDDGGPAEASAFPHHVGRTISQLGSWNGGNILSPLG